MKALSSRPSELAEAIRQPSRSARFSPAPGDFELARPRFSPLRFLSVAWRQKWKILLFIFTSMLMTYLVSSRLSPLYEASAQLDLERQTPANAIGQGPTTVSPNDSDAFMATQMELLRSDAVLRPVADRYHLLQRENQSDEERADLNLRRGDAPVVLKRLKVTRPPNTYLLDVSYKSMDPQLSADVANAVAQSYLDRTFERRAKASAPLPDSMPGQMDESRARMERSELALASFEQQLNLTNPEDESKIVSARLLEVNEEYTKAQADRLAKEAEFRSTQTGGAAEALVTSQGAQLAKLQEGVNTAKQHLADVAAVFGPNHPEYRKAKGALEERQREFNELHSNVSQRAEAAYDEAVNRENILRSAVQSTKAEYARLSSELLEYQRLKRDAETDKSLYSDMQQRIREAAINAGLQNSLIQIADKARPPEKPVFPDKKLNLLISFVFSSVFAVCFVLMAEAMDHTIRDPEQAARALDTSVLGALPAVKSLRLLDAAQPELAGYLESSEDASRQGLPHTSLKLTRYQGGLTRYSRRKTIMRFNEPADAASSSYEEAIRTLRHSILLPDVDRNMKSLLITSALAGEGKSTAIIHLAVAHAEQGKRTLIIDADLRRPSIHRKLGISGTLGLSNVLLGEFAWREMVAKVEQWPSLEVLPAGMVSRRASDLVGGMMTDILDEASREYDLILVDGPPLLGFAEGMQIAKAVDGVVVMARAGRTSKRAVATVLATLHRLQAHAVGVVLNQVNKASTQDFYYGNVAGNSAMAFERRI